MKKKFSKILGVGLTLVMVLALTASFTLPVGASPDENAWSRFAYPAEGETGGWFYDPAIVSVGPIAKAIDGTLYAAVTNTLPDEPAIPAGGTYKWEDTSWDGWLVAEGTTFFTDPSRATGEWTSEKRYSPPFSAKLTMPAVADLDWHDTAEVRVPCSIPWDTTNITATSFTFHYLVEQVGTAVTNPYPVLYLDTVGDDGIPDICLHGSRVDTGVEVGTGKWVTTYAIEEGPGSWREFSYNPATEAQSQNVSNHADTPTAAAAYPGATLVGVALGWASNNVNCGGDILYVDDISINGTCYRFDPDPMLLKSTNGGRSWAETYYSDPTYGVEGGSIVAIACSSIDEDIVYVADYEYVYKTEDAGDTFDFVSASTLEDLMGTLPFNTGPVITSLAVSYADDEPHVYIGVATTDNAGGVGYIYDVAFGGGWTDLELDYSVYGIGTSPDFDNDALVVAVATDGSETFACSNYGAAIGAWGEVELEDSSDASITDLTEASDPAFPEDFDATDAYEFFVGLSTTAGDTGVYRVYDTTFDLLDYVVGYNIISLDLVGEVGDTMLLAGEKDAVDIWWSTNDGDTWKNAVDYGLPPTGSGPTYVVMDDDFATNDTAWAATAGAEGAVSLSVDGGEIWHGISLISTDIDAVRGVALSPGYATDETLFLLTRADDEDTESLFKYDGANWVRVFEHTLYDTLYTAPDEADLVAVSPDFATDETVFVGYTADGTIFRSTDAGISFAKQRVDAPDLLSWSILDSDTIMAGGDGEVHKTENYGRRTWTTYPVTGSTADIESFAVVGETIMVGDADGAVFVSEDAGEEWEQVGDAPTDLDISAAAILVAFDGDIIYAASTSQDKVGRCVIDTDEDWEDQIWEDFTNTTLVAATVAAAGIVISPDGTLYVVDATDVNADDFNGVWRSLNPDEEDIDDAVFEAVTWKLRTTAELALAGFSVGSNVLWATNAEAGAEDELWTYEDTLATEVILSTPVSGMAVTDTDKATLEWFELTGAGEYEVVVNTRDDFLAGTQVFTTDEVEETWVTAKATETDEGLDPGTTYYWRVRVAEGEPLLSRWSETRSFITALSRVTPPDTMWYPDIGADDVTLSPTFSWAEVTGATSYKIIVATESTFDVANRIVETMVTTHFYPCDVRLSYNTTYYWRVKAFKDSVVVSDWTTGMFTTMAKPVPVTPPVEVVTPPPSEITVEVPPVEVVVPPAQVIAPTWLYVIIGIGAVLVIAVIVLIVRTRRVT